MRQAGPSAVPPPSPIAPRRYVAAELEGVADAVVDSWGELHFNDLSTPGAYWLNTMVPVAPHGGPADPESPLSAGAEASTKGAANAASKPAAATPVGRARSGPGNGDATVGWDEDDEDASARRILADLDPL